MNSTDVTFDPMTVPLDHGQLIEASAGTGKTYTITNLCLRLLLGRNSPWQRPLAINEILILTFTIAATAELKFTGSQNELKRHGAPLEPETVTDDEIHPTFTGDLQVTLQQT